MPDSIKRRRACLIGIADYDSEEISDLPIVRSDATHLQSILEKSGYQVDPHCPSPNEQRISRSKLRTIIKNSCRAAGEGDTLIVYFSGHGGHFKGKDYLVPSDANLNDAEDIEEYLLPVSTIAEATEDCRAGTVLFLIDACREGIKQDAKAIELRSWSEEEQRLFRDRSVIVVFGCAKGQYAHFHEDIESGFSLFTEAVCRVLDTGHPAVSLHDVLKEADKILDGLVREHNKPPQTIWVLGETAVNRNRLAQVICDGPGGPAASGPNPWTEAIRASRLWPDHPLTGEFKSAAASLADACWLQQQTARQILPHDPWVDDRLPVRLLAALRTLTSGMERLDLSPAEVALLCLAPVLREAVLARAAQRMAGHEPLKLEDTGSALGIRAMLEKVHRSFPGLLRKAARLGAGGNQQAAQEVALWLMHRALLREPGVWSPSDRHAGLLDGPIIEALNHLDRAGAPIGSGLATSRLLELSRCCFADPERIERKDRPGAFQGRVYCSDERGEECVIRERLLGYLLIIAGAMAIDTRLLSGVLVEHIGLSHTPPLATLTQEIASAGWEPESGGRRLKAVCTHPATDYALREHVEYANTLLSAAFRATEQSECRPLEKLPARFVAEGVRAAETDSGPAYRTPHLRFRLAQDQVLELLMGEQLYGDPALAIRELYQNSLDACRYAQARLTYLKRAGQSNVLDSWSGRIRFFQGIDDLGRPFIECEDNGIGMGVRELTDTFTQAGRRFADTPEFIEEQTEWLSHDVRLYPNSQFGIGVLSYFMLADDFEVETCRMDRKGLPGESLHASISGSGSLIRLRPGARNGTGTRIRLYLSRTQFNDQPVSVIDTMARLLWVAEFSTEVSDGERALHWIPGRLGHDNNPQALAATCMTSNPDFWWRAARFDPWPDDEARLRKVEEREKKYILSDGLLTFYENETPLCIVNLRAEKRPRLSVDRKQALSFDADWIKTVAESETASLETWDAQCLSMVVSLAEHYPNAADRLWKALQERGEPIPIASSLWHDKDDLILKLDMHIHPSMGCFGPDLNFFDRLSRSRASRNSLGFSIEALSSAYKVFPPVLVLSRFKTLLRVEPSRFPESVAVVLESVAEAIPCPSDAFLISRNLDGKGPWLDREVPPGHILRAAAELGRSPSEVASRLRSLGFTLPGTEPDWESVGTLNKEDLTIISRDLYGRGPWLDREVPLGHILRAAAKLGRSPSEVASRLRSLGFTLPGTEPDWESVGTLNKEDLTIIPRDLDGEGPWLDREVPPGHILMAAAELGRSPSEVASRLRSLGFTLPGTEPDWESVGTLNKEDLTILSRDLDGEGPWLDREVPLGHILGAAAELGRSPSEVASRLLTLGFEIQPGFYPHELEIIVQIWHECSREEATQMLMNAGWEPAIEVGRGRTNLNE